MRAEVKVVKANHKECVEAQKTEMHQAYLQHPGCVAIEGAGSVAKPVGR